MTDNQLNALVAEKVMGYKSRSNEAGTVYTTPNSYEVLAARDLPDYANDIAAAWRVWERMGTGWIIYNSQDGIGIYDSIYNLDEGRAIESGVSLPRTICLAALKTIGINYVKK